MNKKILIGAIESIVGILFITLLYFNIPGRFFIYNTILDCNLYDLIYLFNYTLYFIISLALIILFERERFHFKGFTSYIIILAIMFVLNLLFIFIQDFTIMGHPMSWFGILMDGIFIPFYKEFVKCLIIFGLILFGMYRIMDFEKIKGLMALVFSITLCVGVSLLFHLSEASNYFYYISYGFCVGVSGYYLIEKTNSLLTPITYFGLSKICVLPNCFSSVFSETILPIANIGGGIIYLLIGIVLIFIIFYDFKYERE